MKDSTRDRVSSWWWNWKPVVAILAVAIIVTSLVTAVIFIRVKVVEPNHPTYTYTQDKKTGLCFAHGETGGLFGGHTLTNVPCTEAVLKEISTAKE